MSAVGTPGYARPRMHEKHNETAPRDTPVEHLVTWQESPARMVVLALDAACRPVSITTFCADAGQTS